MGGGSGAMIGIPEGKTLARYSATVVKNNGFDETRKVLTQLPRATAPRAVPRRPGDPSLIRHVIFIIKENRTYDQVLGDLKQGDGDPSLVLFGRDVTPNHHALAEAFVVFDNCYADAHVSTDGHNSATAPIATDYVQKIWPANDSGRNRAFDFTGGSAAPRPPRAR